MNEIGIFLNCDKRDSVEMARKCIEFFKTKSVKSLMLRSQMQEMGGCFEAEGCLKDVFFSRPDCIVTLGGDGTLLGAARHASAYEVPICGINLGKLGFLTEGDTRDYEDILTQLCQGDYVLDQRMMLECRITKADGSVETQVALNDVLIKNSGFRMMVLKTYVDGEELDTLRADGLIIASPTGSTAYSLAAGGPVVVPETDVILVNPICPHRLHDRAYIVASRSVIDLRLAEGSHNNAVSIDGQITIPVSPRDQIQVRKAPHYTNLVRFKNMHFFDRLRKKLLSETNN